MDIEALKPFLGELAELSGQVILKYYRRGDLGIEHKADDSPVTVADKAAEEVIIRRIREKFPEHGLLAEESGNDKEGADWTWVIDPIDGTKSFIGGVPLFTTLIGLLHEGRPVLGCIHQPVLGQLMVGDNKTTTLNGEPVRIREARALNECTLLTSDVLDPEKFQSKAAWDRLTGSVRMLRTWADGYGYLLVASGYADIIADAILSPWDILPIAPIMRGAGATMTDWQGDTTQPLKSTVAANARIHRMALDILMT